ncbi:hypothetical protein [Chroococcidiopsis sp. CCALA 051]|uniref:hypothetical protein n=1 Tax=Chroococcidiopsis sp. CCALA 051 TaxID=869949 RepID=UPI0011B23239|nr:hypothetical protein [Chroococcidiopsis sp. CCALA 051]
MTSKFLPAHLHPPQPPQQPCIFSPSLLAPHPSLLAPHPSLLAPDPSSLTPRSSPLTPRSSLLTPHFLMTHNFFKSIS